MVRGVKIKSFEEQLKELGVVGVVKIKGGHDGRSDVGRAVLQNMLLQSTGNRWKLH